MTITNLGQRQLAFTDWDKLPDHPIQRNTEEHAQKARNRHLRQSSEVHKHTNAVIGPDGWMYKLDGHTRTFLWRDGSLEAPSAIIANVWQCDTDDEMDQLYRMFDNKAAAEVTSDEVYGAFKKYGFEPESPMIRNRRCIAGLKLANDTVYGDNKKLPHDRATDIIVSRFIDELRLLDECSPDNRQFWNGITGAALVTFKKYGRSIQTFWELYAANNGWKSGNVADPVETLSLVLAENKQRQGAGFKANITLLKKAVRCVESWRSDKTHTVSNNGRTYLREPKSLDSYKVKEGVV